MKSKIGEQVSKKEFLKKIKNKNNDALNIAIDIRKFEVDLYWKRATYFWTFNGAILAGYLLVISKDSPDSFILLLIESIGIVFSLGWFLVNRGSKYWSDNWENIVNTLEDRNIGPLFKHHISRTNYKLRKVLEPFPFSVTKINHLLSFYIFIIWLILYTRTNIMEYRLTIENIDSPASIINIVTMLSSIYMVVCCRSKSNKLKDIDFETGKSF